MRLYKPEVFQGNLRKKNYFEGWYFKQVTRDLSDTVSVIPGISIVKSDPHAFIQVVNGSTGTSDYVRYPPDEFKWERRRLYVKVGSSVFTSGGVVLDIRGESASLTWSDIPGGSCLPESWDGTRLCLLWNAIMV